MIEQMQKEHKSDSKSFQTEVKIEESHIIFSLNISKITEFDNAYYIKTYGVPDSNSFDSVFFMTIFFPKLVMSDDGVYIFPQPKLIFYPQASNVDPNKTNFGAFLHKYLPTSSQSERMRNCHMFFNDKLSKNFLQNQILEKSVFLYLLITCDQKILFSITIDWENKSLTFFIPIKNGEKFNQVFFLEKLHKNIQTSTDVIGTFSEANVVKKYNIKGFDKKGEPTIEEYNSGALRIVFEFMPPFNKGDDQSDLEVFEVFDEKLAEITGCEIIWDDREIFLINSPHDDTIIKISTFLSNFWKNRNHWKLLDNEGSAKKSASKTDKDDTTVFDMIEYFERTSNISVKYEKDENKKVYNDNTSRSFLKLILRILAQLFR